MKTIKKHRKKWIQRGVIGALIAIITITPVSGITLADNTTSPVTKADTEDETSNIIEVDSVKDLKDNITNTEIDALVIEGEKKKVLESSLVQEYLDDGVNVFIEGDCKDKIEETFDEEIGIHHGNNEKMLGYYVSSDGENHDFTAVSKAAFSVRENQLKSIDINKVKDSSDLKIDTNQIVNDMKESDIEPDVNHIYKDNIQSLQGATVSNCIIRSRMTVYAFMHNNINVKSACVGSKKEIPADPRYDTDGTSDWMRIATFATNVEVFPNGKVGNKYYTYVRSMTSITPTARTAVIKYRHRNTVVNNKNNVRIFKSTPLKGNQITENVNFSVGLGTSSISGGLGISYSFNPQGETINRILNDEDANTWEATPQGLTPCYGQEYEVEPTECIESKKDAIARIRTRLTYAKFLIKYLGCLCERTFNTDNNLSYIDVRFKNNKSVGQEVHKGC